MSLTIKELYFRNFRNYEELHLTEINPITVFVGPNAVGKTNIIEGIQLLTALSSFKNQPCEYQIKKGENQSLIKLCAQDNQVDRKVDITLSLQKGKRKYQLNGKPKRPMDLRGIIPAVIFTPDDLDLVKGSGSTRRASIDALGSQLSKNHASIKKDFDIALKQKNQLLKEFSSQDFLDSINEIFIKCSAQLTCYRLALVRKLNPYIKDIYQQISGKRETLSVQYIPSWDKDSITTWSTQTREKVFEVIPAEARELLTEEIKKNNTQEILRQHSLYGAHTDRIDFFLNGNNAADFASQGQQRSIVLSFKLAEVALIEELLNQRPILLLDDVMSELDKSRRDALVSCVKNSTQVFITTTNLSYFEDSLFASTKPITLPFT